MYIADNDNNRIRKVTVSTDIITTIAGTGSQSFSGDGGAATSATLCLPIGVSVDATGTKRSISVIEHHFLISLPLQATFSSLIGTTIVSAR